MSISEDLPEEGCQLIFQAEHPFTGKRIDIKIPLDSKRVLRGSLIHKLSARSRIRELEEQSSNNNKGGNVEQEVTRLALNNNLMSTYTSFVAVHQPKGENMSK